MRLVLCIVRVVPSMVALVGVWRRRKPIKQAERHAAWAEELGLVRRAVRHLVRQLRADAGADGGLGGAEGEGGEAEADERAVAHVGGRRLGNLRRR